MPPYTACRRRACQKIPAKPAAAHPPNPSRPRPAARRKPPRDISGAADEQAPRDHDTDQFRARDKGNLGEWDWRHARRGEVEGDYGRAYGHEDNGTYHRDAEHGTKEGPTNRDGPMSRQEAHRRLGKPAEDRDQDPRHSPGKDEPPA